MTVASGEGELSRGAVLGKVSVGGKCILSVADAEDGSEVPCAILAQDVDATSDDVYIKGEFNERALTLGAGHTADSIRDALADLDIILRGSVAA